MNAAEKKSPLIRLEELTRKWRAGTATPEELREMWRLAGKSDRPGRRARSLL